MKRGIILLSSLFFISSCQQKAEQRESDGRYKSIDSTLSALQQQDKFSGNVLIEINDTIVFNKSYGYADRDTKRMLNDSSIFELASISKQFTAAGILLLKEKGLLDYTDKAINYLPGLPYKDITIYQLLTHTSGLPEYEPLVKQYWNTSVIIHNSDVLQLLQKHNPRLLFTPGERMEYSDAGYILLSLIIEKVSQMPFAKYMEEYVFRPTGMKHTLIYNTRRSGGPLIGNYALGYVYIDSLHKYLLPDSLPEHHDVYYLDGIEGEGKVNTTTSDLILWHRALRNHTLLKKETVDLAFSKAHFNNGSTAIMTPVYDSSKYDYYGFGYFIDEDPKLGKIVFHSGGYGGYRTYLWHAPEQKISFVMLGNTFSEEARAYRLKIVEEISLQAKKAIAK